MKKFLIVIGVALGLVVLVTCVGAALSGINAVGESVPETYQNTTTIPDDGSRPSAGDSKAPGKSVPKINGDDLVHVGEDIPAGTYRAVEAVEDYCYWAKMKTADGGINDIIENDSPSGGRPQVTLKKGQWFKSNGCPDWIKK